MINREHRKQNSGSGKMVANKRSNRYDQQPTNRLNLLNDDSGDDNDDDGGNICDYELVTNDGGNDYRKDDEDGAFSVAESERDRIDSGYRKIAESFNAAATTITAATATANHDDSVTLGKLNFDHIKAIDDRLRLCLTTDKIALNNRAKLSIERRRRQSSDGAYENTKLFTIVPINLSRNDQLPGGSDRNKLPEIVLTSFDPSAMASRRFDVAHTLATKVVEQQHQSTSLVGGGGGGGGGAFYYHNDHNDVFDEPGTNSPSPESFVDNQLSAASSVSLRSSDGGGDCVGDGDGASSDSFEMAQLSDCSSLNSSSVLRDMKLDAPKESSAPLQKELFKHQIPTKDIAVAATSVAAAATSTSTSRIDSQTQQSSEGGIQEFPDELKCYICQNILKDPRTLNCLHSFCFQCLVDENFKLDSSIPFWSQPDQSKAYDWKSSTNATNSTKSPPESSPDNSYDNGGGSSSATTPVQRRGSRTSFASFRRKKSFDKLLSRPKSADASPQRNSEKPRTIQCKRCEFVTQVPIGGIRQLPQNFVALRKIDRIRMKIDDDVISKIWCSLCCVDTTATYHCVTCILNLCSFCKEAHARQRNTSNHKIKSVVELRKSRKLKKDFFDGSQQMAVNCPMHPGYEMKSFCFSCFQVACTDCLALQHKGHRHEPIAKAFSSYRKILRESTERTRFLPEYAEHSSARLDDIAKTINSRCDNIQQEVETFIQSYTEAVELHRQTMLRQIQRAREAKIEMILEQKLDMEKRSKEALEAVQFSQELIESGSQAEILSFANILLKRFELCQKFRTPIDVKICDSLKFLPQIRAPSNKKDGNIPIFGIITTQTVEPTLCSLETEGFTQLRLHRKVELLVITRDANAVPMCHGGLTVNAQLKYKENPGKRFPIEIHDRRDGTYAITFVPDAQGTMSLMVTIKEKQIKGSPFVFAVRTVRPHNGIFHCCAFCSSKGSKLVKCSCDGRMPGYDGCGHGHEGHPGRRHWSCCGNVLENSECSATNNMLNL